MWHDLATKLAVWLLRKSDLSVENRSILTSSVLKELVAAPLCDIITKDNDGVLVIDGKKVDFEQARKLRESARAALNNYALQHIQRQVMFRAITTGFHHADNERQAFFGKAAIWWFERELEYLHILAQTITDENAEVTSPNL